MAIYAIGDVQGCFDELKALVEKISFNPKLDHLWFVGDLVNRGPNSLETLRWVKSLGDRAITVLGNHDLHLLAAFAGVKQINSSSSLYPVLQANDVEELIDWLRNRPLMHFDQKLNFAMVHGGIIPQWSIKKALSRAKEVETGLRSKKYKEFLENMYGDKPDQWDKSLNGWDRLRVITNIFTRMRYCNNEGIINFSDKGPPGTQKAGLQPWFEIKKRQSQNTTIIFGHWSTLGHYKGNNVIALDTGCLWGGFLTAVRIDDTKNKKYQIECEAKRGIPDSS